MGKRNKAPFSILVEYGAGLRISRAIVVAVPATRIVADVASETLRMASARRRCAIARRCRTVRPFLRTPRRHDQEELTVGRTRGNRRLHDRDAAGVHREGAVAQGEVAVCTLVRRQAICELVIVLAVFNVDLELAFQPDQFLGS